MTDPLALLGLDRPRTGDEDRALAAACRDTIARYRAAVAGGAASSALAGEARRAFLHLGGDPDRATASLRDYDHGRYGPFLGVSDEGSAAANIRDAAFASPKVRALPAAIARTPLVVGVAVDAERLVAVGECVVGPHEYADIWLQTVDRVLVTTNIGTQVNLRVYRPEPRVEVASARPDAIARAKDAIRAEFAPFVETPDRKPRPRTVFVEFPPRARVTAAQKKAVLRELAAFVSSGAAAGQPRAPDGHVLGLAASIGNGKPGREAAKAVIALASTAGLPIVLLDARRSAEPGTVARAGLREAFRPGLIAQILRHAQQEGVAVRTANLPDTDTIARSIWVGLNTARSMGANLGKYGCVPLTLDGIEHVVSQVQGWMAGWSAAPVFFVDEGLYSGRVDVGKDLPRGIETWLSTVATRGARVVLIDTVDKASGRRLLKSSSKDDKGFLTIGQIGRIERFARRPDVNIRVLWAGGLGLRDAYEMGRLGVFGIYVTSATATTIPVAGDYVRDRALAALKEPSKDGVLQTKTLLEAGFLASRLEGRAVGDDIARAADNLIAALDAKTKDAAAIRTRTNVLASACVTGWKQHWQS